MMSHFKQFIFFYFYVIYIAFYIFMWQLCCSCASVGRSNKPTSNIYKNTMYTMPTPRVATQQYRRGIAKESTEHRARHRLTSRHFTTRRVASAAHTHPLSYYNTTIRERELRLAEQRNCGGRIDYTCIVYVNTC